MLDNKKNITVKWLFSTTRHESALLAFALLLLVVAALTSHSYWVIVPAIILWGEAIMFLCYRVRVLLVHGQPIATRSNMYRTIKRVLGGIDCENLDTGIIVFSYPMLTAFFLGSVFINSSGDIAQANTHAHAEQVSTEPDLKEALLFEEAKSDQKQVQEKKEEMLLVIDLVIKQQGIDAKEKDARNNWYQMLDLFAAMGDNGVSVQERGNNSALFASGTPTKTAVQRYRNFSKRTGMKPNRWIESVDEDTYILPVHLQKVLVTTNLSEMKGTDSLIQQVLVSGDRDAMKALYEIHSGIPHDSYTQQRVKSVFG